MAEFVRNLRENRSLIFYCVMKLEWGKEEYTFCCTRNERSGLARFKLGIWKLRGVRRRFKKGRCHLYREEIGVIHAYTIKRFGNEGMEGTVFE
jgi:ribosomal protein L37AE/L43A